MRYKDWRGTRKFSYFAVKKHSANPLLFYLLIRQNVSLTYLADCLGFLDGLDFKF